MPAKTRAAILAEIGNLVPDNTVGAITPAFLRAVLQNLADSAIFPEDGPFTGGGGGSDPGPVPPAPSDFNADFNADFGAAI